MFGKQVTGMLAHAPEIMEARRDEGDSLVTPLIIACRSGRPDVALALIERRADVNATEEDAPSGIRPSSRRTPLMFALDPQTPRSPHWRVVRALIAHGANVNAVDANGLPVLAYAMFAEERDPDAPMFRTLIDHGANTDAAWVLPTMEFADNGKTALMFACKHLHWNMARVLMEREVNVNATDKRGKTALMYMADQPRHFSGIQPFLNPYPTLVRELVALGADVHAADVSNNTALTIARRAHNETMARVLIEHGAGTLPRLERAVLLVAAAIAYSQSIRALFTLLALAAFLFVRYGFGNGALCARFRRLPQAARASSRVPNP